MLRFLSLTKMIKTEKSSGNTQQPCENLILWNKWQSSGGNTQKISLNCPGIWDSFLLAFCLFWHLASCTDDFMGKKEKKKNKKNLFHSSGLEKKSSSKYPILLESLRTSNCCMKLSLNNPYNFFGCRCIHSTSSCAACAAPIPQQAGEQNILVSLTGNLEVKILTSSVPRLNILLCNWKIYCPELIIGEFEASQESAWRSCYSDCEKLTSGHLSCTSRKRKCKKILQRKLETSCKVTESVLGSLKCTQLPY